MANIIDLRKKRLSEETVSPTTNRETVSITQQPKPVFKKPEKENLESTKTISWLAPSFYHNPQKKYLVLAVLGLIASAGVALFFQKDILTTIFFLLSAVVVVFYANKKPTLSRIVVNGSGVAVDDRIYHYRELQSFWLDYNPSGQKELSLESKKWYLPFIKVSIENENPVEIRSLIIGFVQEKEHQNSLLDFIGKKIGL